MKVGRETPRIVDNATNVKNTECISKFYHFSLFLEKLNSWFFLSRLKRFEITAIKGGRVFKKFWQKNFLFFNESRPLEKYSHKISDRSEKNYQRYGSLNLRASELVFTSFPLQSLVCEKIFFDFFDFFFFLMKVENVKNSV